MYIVDPDDPDNHAMDIEPTEVIEVIGDRLRLRSLARFPYAWPAWAFTLLRRSERKDGADETPITTDD